MSRSAILFIVFNRPRETRAVFDAIRRAKPARLYLAADGPRSPSSHPHDREKCQATRDIINHIDWPCETRTRFLDENMGCGRAVSSAIDWFFSSEQEGIILEDDCLPNQDFFRWQDLMLERYRTNDRVMHVNGTNLCASRFVFGSHAYAYSSFASVWGWASWRRAWRLYARLPPPASVPPVGRFRASGISYYQAKSHRRSVLAAVNGSIDTWDYQWSLANFSARSLVPTPCANLVTNIGHGDDATHTVNPDSAMANIPLGNLFSEGSSDSPSLLAPPFKACARLNAHVARINCGSPWHLVKATWLGRLRRLRNRALRRS